MEVTAPAPFVFQFLEVRELEPGVRIATPSNDGEQCTTHYPESVGIINSYSDTCSD